MTPQNYSTRVSIKGYIYIDIHIVCRPIKYVTITNTYALKRNVVAITVIPGENPNYLGLIVFWMENSMATKILLLLTYT